ncbi:hypothetical protein [Halorussus litoreus]|uniref:hypothetical protein n=1 Tax=Halorussus litoreus TaxID=1710536 RepID=UPI000E279B44|nr:hypothetical protein [Halorussus litoreus]
MAEPGWARHALSIGVFEFRRSVRAIWRDKARFGLTALGVAIPSLMVTAFAVVFADAIRGVESLPVSQIRGTVALFWLFAVFLVGQRVVSARTRIEAEPLVLTTVSARTTAGGLLLAEILRVLAYVGLPVLVLTGVGVFLFGSLASLVLIPAAAVLFTATAVVAGSGLGYAVAWVVATSRFVARHKTVLGSLASLLVMGGYFLFFFPEIGGVSQTSLAWLPVGWFADLGTLGTGLMASSLRAVGVLVVSGVLLLAGGALVERETVALWFTDPVSVESGGAVRDRVGQVGGQSESEDYPTRIRNDALAAAVKPLAVPGFVPAPARRVAEWVILRTRRDPNRLTFLLIPVFAVGSPLVSTGLQSGAPFALLAPVSAVVLPWLAGSLFALNPLGDEGAVLPVTLTAVSGTQYVRGLMVPGLLFGTPVVAVVTGVVGGLSLYPPAEVAGLVGLGAYLTCVAVAITPAIGMALPRFSAISVGQSRNVLPPRLLAVAVHAALTVLPGALLAALVVAPGGARAVLAGLFGFVPAILLELLVGSNGGALVGVAEAFRGVGESVQGIGLDQLRVVGGGAVLLGGVLVSVLLYRNAVSRFERYSPP